MLHLMKEYIDVKLNIEDVIKTGCLHLAKSRYIMGNRNVSALQLPTEDSDNITASTTIITKENNDTGENLKNNDNEIRQRLKDNKPIDKDDNNSENNTTTKSSTIKDPLKWFGVLIPQDMRQAQSNFNKAIEYVVECANIQLEMLSIEEKYKKCLAKKNELSKQ
ncbi:hypothetical protein O3M35_003518 [Rhynocoris fuscipes]|uniref:Vacuolar ATPase assembly protein VMA22 n=1 Tax=Rhynocoris fuscipes TaxID=488301 RepID=A0AAW1CQ91_9HEMI